MVPLASGRRRPRRCGVGATHPDADAKHVSRRHGGRDFRRRGASSGRRRPSAGQAFGAARCGADGRTRSVLLDHALVSSYPSLYADGRKRPRARGCNDLFRYRLRRINADVDHECAGQCHPWHGQYARARRCHFWRCDCIDSCFGVLDFWLGTGSRTRYRWRRLGACAVLRHRRRHSALVLPERQEPCALRKRSIKLGTHARYSRCRGLCDAQPLVDQRIDRIDDCAGGRLCGHDRTGRLWHCRKIRVSTFSCGLRHRCTTCCDGGFQSRRGAARACTARCADGRRHGLYRCGNHRLVCSDLALSLDASIWFRARHG